MNIGKLVGSATVSAIKEWNPLGPEAYARRDLNKAYRKARRKKRRGEVLTPEEEALMAENTVTLTLPDGSTVDHTPPTIAARTSTKLAVGGGVIGAFPAVEVLSWVQGLQLEPSWLESATNSPYFVYYGTLLVAWIITRISKSPLQAKAL